jgi:hypothetical protein
MAAAGNGGVNRLCIRKLALPELNAMCLCTGLENLISSWVRLLLLCQLREETLDCMRRPSTDRLVIGATATC